MEQALAIAPKYWKAVYSASHIYVSVYLKQVQLFWIVKFRIRLKLGLLVTVTSVHYDITGNLVLLVVLGSTLFRRTVYNEYFVLLHVCIYKNCIGFLSDCIIQCIWLRCVLLVLMGSLVLVLLIWYCVTCTFVYADVVVLVFNCCSVGRIVYLLICCLYSIDRQTMDSKIKSRVVKNKSRFRM